MTGENSNFLFDVRRATGDKATQKTYEHQELASWKIVPVAIKSKESSSDPIDVSRLYNLPPDTYLVRVTRRLPNGGYITSTPITVEVTGP